MNTVTVCRKQENMSRLTLAERIVIEYGIYEKLKLSEIAKKIGKSLKMFQGRFEPIEPYLLENIHLERIVVLPESVK